MTIVKNMRPLSALRLFRIKSLGVLEYVFDNGLCYCLLKMIEVCSEKEKLVGMAATKSRSRLLLFTTSVFQLCFFSERAGLDLGERK